MADRCRRHAKFGRGLLETQMPRRSIKGAQCGSLIPRRARASAALRPPAGDLVLLTNARFIREPNLYFPNIDCLFARDFIQARWELFLKSSMAPSACA
jgi:hypothetical protein